MTREEEIINAAYDEAEVERQLKMHPQVFEQGFVVGAKWADAHPNWTEIVKRMQEEITNDLRNDRWISVDDELPKEHEWILGFSLKRSYIDVYNFDSNGLIEAHGITHWMHLSPPPIIISSKKGGEQ